MEQFNVVTTWEIVGGIATLTSAAVTYLKSSADAKQLNTTFVTLLGSIATMLFSLRFAILPNMLTYLDVASKLSSIPDHRAMIEEIVAADRNMKQTSADAIDRGFPALIVEMRMRNLKRYFDEFQRGTFSLSVGEVPDFALKLFDKARRKVTATSYVTPDQWWNTPWGKRYLEKNRDALGRKVAIERVFILKDSAALASQRELLDAQKQMGVKLKVAYVSQLGGDVTSDMVLVDDSLSGELLLTPDKGMKEARFSNEPATVADVRERIERLLNQAAEYP